MTDRAVVTLHQDKTEQRLLGDRVAGLVGRLRKADGERALGMALAEVFSEVGAEVELDWVVPDRPNVVATLRGSDGCPALMLAGHLNTAHHPGVWSHDPHQVQIEAGRVQCGAVTDMLGGWAAIAAALSLISERGGPAGDVVVLASMSHDIMATGIKHAIAARSELPSFSIWCDPTDLAIVTVHGGAVRYEVELSGCAAHVSELERGVDALAAAVALTPALATAALTHLPDERYPDLPRHLIGRLEAGTGPGLVADRALIAGDIRTVPGMTRATVRRDLERAVQAGCPAEIAAEVRVTAEQRPLQRESSGALVEALRNAHREVVGDDPEEQPRLPSVAFCTAAADLQAAGIDTVVYGPGSFRWTPDESVSIADLVTAAEVYAALPEALAKPGLR